MNCGWSWASVLGAEWSVAWWWVCSYTSSATNVCHFQRCSAISASNAVADIGQRRQRRRGIPPETSPTLPTQQPTRGLTAGYSPTMSSVTRATHRATIAPVHWQLAAYGGTLTGLRDHLVGSTSHGRAVARTV